MIVSKNTNLRSKNAEIILANELRGNWRKWSDFSSGLSRIVNDPENFGIVYTSNRDSRLLDKSNERAILARLKAIDPDCKNWQEYRASHFAVGYVDGFIIRPFNPGTKRYTYKQLTPVFKELFEIACELDNYPVLDEQDYSDTESLATHENIKDELDYTLRSESIDIVYPVEIPEYTVYNWRIGGYTASNIDQLAYAVESWLTNTNTNQLENIDDNGGYADKDDILLALKGLSIIRDCVHCTDEIVTNGLICDYCLDAGINPYDYMPINDPTRYDNTLL